MLAFLVGAGIGCGQGAGELRWAKSFSEAYAQARKEDRLIMIKFTAEWCGPCKDLEHMTLSEPSVTSELNHVIPVRVDVDTPDGRRLSDDFRISSLPTVLFMMPDGSEVSRMVGVYPPDEFLSFFHSVQAKAQKN